MVKLKTDLYARGGKTVVPSRLIEGLAQLASEGIDPAGLAFVCIGTDRSTGDALGPLTGTKLTGLGFARVIGTLEQPCDSGNLTARLGELPQGCPVIGIDAALGAPSDVGSFRIARKPVYPGRSMGKALPPVGAYSITGIVGENRGNPYTVLQAASLYRVMRMASQLAEAIFAVFPPRGGGSTFGETDFGEGF